MNCFEAKEDMFRQAGGVRAALKANSLLRRDEGWWAL